MSKFGKGDKVKNVVTNEIGYVIEVYPPRRGRQLYKECTAEPTPCALKFSHFCRFVQSAKNSCPLLLEGWGLFTIFAVFSDFLKTGGK